MFENLIAESFTTWFVLFQKMSLWLKNDPNTKLYFKILVGSLVYGFIIFRFFKAYLDHKKELRAAESAVEIEKQRTAQFKIIADSKK